ncbi:hypothetical protein [Ensifer adhaerens]|nr:hypothetical protein [Ensifer adhaerens]
MTYEYLGARGVLVAAWRDPTGNKEDESFLDLDVKENPAIDENEI